MCRPGHVPLGDPFTGGHIGPPLRGAGSVPEPTGIGAEQGPCGAGQSPPPTGGPGVDRRRGEVTPPYGCNAGGAQQRADVGSGPYGETGKLPRPPGPAAHSEASAPAGARDGWKLRQRPPPKGASNAGQSLSQPAADSSLCTKGALGDGGCGLPRRFAPRNDSPKPLSSRGGQTGRRGNPSFLRWTKDGGSGRRVVGPYGRSTVASAKGRCRHRPLRDETEVRCDCRGSA